MIIPPGDDGSISWGEGMAARRNTVNLNADSDSAWARERYIMIQFVVANHDASHAGESGPGVQVGLQRSSCTVRFINPEKLLLSSAA